VYERMIPAATGKGVKNVLDSRSRGTRWAMRTRRRSSKRREGVLPVSACRPNERPKRATSSSSVDLLVVLR
jgi:hypothetical protein